MLDSRGLRDKSVWVMEKLFSTKKSIDSVLKNEWFVRQLPEIIRQMLDSEDLKEKTINVVNKLLESDATNEQLKSELNAIVRNEPDTKKITKKDRILPDEW